MMDHEQVRLEIARELIKARGASAVANAKEIVVALRQISAAVFDDEAVQKAEPA